MVVTSGGLNVRSISNFGRCNLADASIGGERITTTRGVFVYHRVLIELRINSLACFRSIFLREIFRQLLVKGAFAISTINESLSTNTAAIFSELRVPHHRVNVFCCFELSCLARHSFAGQGHTPWRSVLGDLDEQFDGLRRPHDPERVAAICGCNLKPGPALE